VTGAVLLALKVAAVLGMAAGLAWTTRRQPPRVRAWLWGAAFAAAAAMPLLSWSLPQIETPLPAASSAGSAVSGPVRVPSPPVAARPAALEPTGGRASADGPAGSAVLPPATLLLLLWAAGAAGVFFKESLGLGRLTAIVRGGARLDGARWQQVFARAAEVSGCRRRVRLLCSQRLAVPVTAGMLRPVVVLPAAAGAWSDEHCEIVLTHELIHVRRHDWAARLLSRLVRTVHWYDPLAWWAASRLETEQERAVDDEVVARGVSRSRYAAHLLEAARAATRLGALPAPALAAARRPRLEDRIMSILEPDAGPRRSAVTGLCAAALTLLLVPVIAAVQPRAGTAGPELSDALRELRDVERRLGPYTDRLAGVEGEMRPHFAGLESIDLAIDHAALERIQAEMAPLQRRLEAIASEMEPIQRRMGEVGESLREVEVGRLSELEAVMEPHLAELEELQEQLEPFLERIEEIHVEMEPLHAELEEIHRMAEPIRIEVDAIQARIEPMTRRLEEVQDEMAPVLAEVERAADRVQAAVVAEIEQAVRGHLGAVSSPGAPFREAAERIVDRGRVEVDGDELRLDADRDDVHDLLRDLFAAHRTGARDVFDAALEAAADALSRYRVSVPAD